jgi:hypothetical protein
LAPRPFRHQADLPGPDLRGAMLDGANLDGAKLQSALLVSTSLADANLTGCRVHGLSAWDLKLAGATQRDRHSWRSIRRPLLRSARSVSAQAAVLRATWRPGRGRALRRWPRAAGGSSPARDSACRRPKARTPCEIVLSMPCHRARSRWPAAVAGGGARAASGDGGGGSAGRDGGVTEGKRSTARAPSRPVARPHGHDADPARVVAAPDRFFRR